MPWARVDDDFFFHPKVSVLLRNEHGWAALGFWVAGLSWAHKYTRKSGKTPGLLTEDDVVRMDPSMGCTFAGLLVKAGLWELAEGGWMIHDFTEYLPSAAMSRSRREAGRKGGLAKAANQALASSQDGLASSQDSLATAKQSPSYGMGTGIGSKSSSDNVNPKSGSNSDRSLTGGAASVAGQRLLDEHIAASSPRPPREILRKTSEVIERLLVEPTDSAVISAALALLRQRPGASPSLLPNLVYDVQRQDNGHFTRSYQRPRRQEDYDMKTPWEGRVD